METAPVGPKHHLLFALHSLSYPHMEWPSAEEIWAESEGHTTSFDFSVTNKYLKLKY